MTLEQILKEYLKILPEKLNIDKLSVAKMAGYMNLGEYEKFINGKEWSREKEKRIVNLLGIHLGLTNLIVGENSEGAIELWYKNEDYILKKAPLELLMDGTEKSLMKVVYRAEEMRDIY
jgi:hypothetical protein